VPVSSGVYQAVIVGNAAHGWLPEPRHDVVKAKRGTGIDGTMEPRLPSGKSFRRQCGSGFDHGGIPIRVGKPGSTVVPGRILGVARAVSIGSPGLSCGTREATQNVCSRSGERVCPLRQAFAGRQ
jgi:hypothetical protein